MRSIFTHRQQMALYYEGAPIGLFFQVDHPDGESFLWTGWGDIMVDGQRWLGTGNAVGLTQVTATPTLATSETGIILAFDRDSHERGDQEKEYRNRLTQDLVAAGLTIDAEVQAFIDDLVSRRTDLQFDGNDLVGRISTNVRGRRAVIYLGIFNDEGLVIDGLVPFSRIRLDFAATSSTEETQDLYILNGTDGGSDFTQPRDTLWTQEYQDQRLERERNLGRNAAPDTGFTDMLSLQKKKVSWVPGSSR